MTHDVHDDLLARDLGAAFHDDTADLTYGGRVPRLRRSPLVAVPAVAAGLALALPVLPALTGGPDDAATTGGDSGATAAPTSPSAVPSSGAPGAAVTRQLAFAGYQVSYTLDAGDPRGPLVARRPGPAVPADARAVPGGPGESVVGVDPATGDAALWTTLPGGDVFVLTGRGWTQDELVAVRQAPSPSTVPLVP